MSSSSSVINILPIVQRVLTFSVYPLYMGFGVFGCLLNLVIFSRPQLRSTSCSIYFLAASADHLATLLSGIGPILYALNHPDPQVQSVIFCKVRGYIFQICLMLSRWFVAFACIDRYALTSEKANLRNFAKPKTAYRIIIAVIIFWSIICTHRLIFYNTDGNVCGIRNNVAAALYHSLYVIIGGGICPAGIMIICALLIRRNLAIKHEKRTRTSTSTNEQRRNPMDQQVLNILFVQIICYIVFTIPQLSNLVFNTISITTPNRSEEHLAVEAFVAFIAEFMLYLFPVTSFYLYTLTSRTFRKEITKFFRVITCRRMQVTPSAADTTIEYRIENQNTMTTSRQPVNGGNQVGIDN